MTSRMPSQSFIAPDSVDRSSSLLLNLALAITIGMAFGAYFVLRYVGLWAENDTAVFTRAVAGMQDAGSFYYPRYYIHGYAYSVWAATLSNFTGVPVAPLIQTYAPLVGSLFMAIFGFATFQRMLGSYRLGLVATALLFLVPELVFTVTRGNHEKLTVSLTLFALLALLHTFLASLPSRSWPSFVAWVLIYYAAVFTLVTTNVLFGTSFIAATTLALLFAVVISVVRPAQRPGLRPLLSRLTFTVVVSWLLVVLVTGYIYPSADNSTRLLRSLADQVVAVFESAGSETETFQAAAPYSVAGTDWVSRPVFTILSAFRWTLFIGSFITWLYLLVRHWPDLDRTKPRRLILIALYGAYGLLLAIAVPIDFLNLYAGTNLQVRIYSYFALLAVPLLAIGLRALVASGRTVGTRQLLRGAIAVLLLAFAPISLLKATLDPAVSNRWHFYRRSETQAMRFWDTRHDFDFLWTDADGRLRHAYSMEFPRAASSNTFDIFTPDPVSAHALYSPVIEANEIAWGQPMPTLWLENRVYDNGFVQILHRRPVTPFQR